MNDLRETIDAALPEIVALRRELHAHPELCFEEIETARRIVERLEALGNLDIRTGVAKTGIVATLNGDKPGPCVALRADMDALPITETTGAPYASEHAGKMHACGHDGHMASLVGAATVLSRLADKLPGKVKFIFQPGEEGGAGGRLMCEEGVLDNPKVDAIYGFHAWPSLEFGHIAIAPGPFMASADFFDATIRGRSSHAAEPHLGIDPIVAASQTVLTLQTIASRRANPLDAVVVTTGQFDAGHAENIIPGEARLRGTIRTLRPEAREMAMRSVKTIIETTAAAHDARADIQFRDGYPVLVNDVKATELVCSIARTIAPPDCVDSNAVPTMGSEDFAFYLQQVPGAYWRLGIGRGPQEDRFALHQPNFDFPDDALPLGIQMHCELAMSALNARP